MVRTTKESYNSYAEVIYLNFFCKQKGSDFNVNALGYSFPETSKAPVAVGGAAASALDWTHRRLAYNVITQFSMEKLTNFQLAHFQVAM